MDIYKQFIRQYGLWIVGIVGICACVGFILPRYFTTSYEVALSLDINREDEGSEEFYSYDGFYAIQAEELFAKTVATWFISPDFVEDILRNAPNVEVQDFSVKDFRSVFSAEQISTNGVEVTFGVADPEQGAELTQAMSQSIQNRLITQKRDNYQIFVGEPVIREKEYNLLFWSIGLGVLGFAVSLAGFALREYLT